MIEPLEPPDSHYLSAAEGWLELGNAAEAAAELRLIGQPSSDHPSVVELDWQIHARARQWDACLELAARLVQLMPDRPVGWMLRSYTLHELKRTLEARDLLLPAISRFPSEAILTYNAACYECRLGNLPAARQWLKRTFALKKGPPFRLEAQTDLDLELLWPEIAEL